MKPPTIDTTETELRTDDLQDHPVSDDATLTDEPIAEITCNKCETTKSWEGGSWCPACGYYPLGNKYINLEELCESHHQDDDDAPETLWQAIPRWAWMVLVGMLAIAAISITVTFSQEAGSPLRSWWAVIQTILGVVLFWAVHMRVFFIATMHTERLTPFSWLTDPFLVWKPIFKEPLNYLWHIRLAVWGQTAALFALLLIGGLNYAGLFEDDWGIKGHANNALVSAIADAQKDGTETDVLSKKMEEKAALLKNRTSSRFNADCVVIGFTRNTDGSFRELLLGSTTGSKLQYVGRVNATDLTTDERLEINALIKTTPQRKESIVETVHNGIWLKPQMMLKVGYHELTATSRFKKIQFQSLLKEQK